MSGERLIPAPLDTVWEALNDLSVLKAAIPGCQELLAEADHRMRAVAAVKVGPITARFAGRVALLDLDPPHGYRIEGEGEGGAAGFAKGGATVRLEPAGAGTRLTYRVDAQVGGRLAQLGARMVDATAKQMSDAFFTRFAAEIAARQAGPAQAQAQAGPDRAAAAAAPPPPAEIALGSLLPATWLLAAGGGVLALLAAVFVARRPRAAVAAVFVARRPRAAVAAGPGSPIVIDAALLDDLRLLQALRRQRGARP